MKSRLPSAPDLLSVVNVQFLGHTLRFAIDDRRDHIQGILSGGMLYEDIEIAKSIDVFPNAKSIVDVGAHIGTHAIAWSVVKQATVYVIEPNREASRRLVTNVALNPGASIVQDYLGVALADQIASATLHQRFDGNLGSTYLELHEPGSIVAVPGDLLFSGRDIDLIKIDVEGLELRVLDGLAKTIRRCRPGLIVEVDNTNSSDFLRWRQENNYSIVWEHARYASNNNYFLSPT